MAKTLSKQRVVGNPGRRKSAYRKPKRRNPGEIIGFTLAGNPGRKVHTGMVKRKKSSGARKSKYRKSASHSHVANPGHRRRSSKRRVSKYNPGRRRKSNPGMLSSGLGPAITNAVFVIVGAVGSKLGAQVILGSKNTGVMGYAGNAGAGAVLWFVAEKVLKNRNAATGIIAGTLVQIILRAINDYTPFGTYLNQLGMGDYQMQSYVTPQVLVDPMRNADVSIPSGWGSRMIAAPAATVPGAVAAGMNGLYGNWGGAPSGALY